VAASSFIGAVLGTASLRGTAVIEPEDRNAPRSGCLDERPSPILEVIFSAVSEAVVARHQEEVGSAGSQSCRGKTSALGAGSSAFEQEFRAQAHRMFKLPIVGKTLSQRRCASSSAGSRLGQPKQALPNPSNKPSPNSKPPGQRYSAGLLLLQRWPGVSPLVPAYVER
jgi:hypothetical protein